MRVKEIEIWMYDRKKCEITGLGEDDHSTDVKKRALIDLDEVESAYEGYQNGIVIIMKSGESYWNKQFSIDQFLEIWKGKAVSKYPKVQIGEPFKNIEIGKIYSGQPEPCSFCGSRDVQQRGSIQTCASCGMCWHIEDKK